MNQDENRGSVFDLKFHEIQKTQTFITII